jgi:Mycobacterial cell wall arabinan synthesis protein
MTEPNTRTTGGPGRRLRAAQALAFVGLFAALVGALGPAERVRTNYTWPPETMPSGSPSRVWYAPLLLVRHRPEELAATIPCALPPALRAAERPVDVLATARDPRRAGALRIVDQGGALTISVGDRVLQRIAEGDAREERACSHRLSMKGDRWLLEGGPGSARRGGRLTEMPVVFGFFSGLDLRSGIPPTIEVTTAAHATRTVTRQTIAWVLAALAIVLALVLVALDGRPRPRDDLRRLVGAAREHVHPVDGLVGLTLLGWWVLAPGFFDDGWVMTRQGTFASSGGFSAYFNTFAANSPLSYELDWLLHWVSQATSDLIVLRLPALAWLALTWILCRWTVIRIVGPSDARRPVVLWTLASAFLVGALAWGMTLRTEPVTALLVVAALLCVISFRDAPRAAPIAVLAAVVPLALTTHPEGIATLALLVAVAVPLLAWVRSQPAAASVIAASGIAWFALLAFLGSDLEQRRADTTTTAESGLTVAWRYEIVRYASLADFPWGTPLRRAAVAVIAIAVLALLLWGRRGGRALLDLPGSALAIALALFVVTPSKHPWHFGALLGLAAVAAASEAARFRQDAERAETSWARPIAVVVAASVVIAWAWAPRQPWNALDLQTLDWTPSFESWLPPATLATVLPVALIAGGLLVEIVRGRRDLLGVVPSRVATWTVPVLCFPLVVFTVAVLVADAAKTDGWTLARANLSALSGDTGCGLADDLTVGDPGSASASSAAVPRRSAPLPPWVPPAPAEGLPRYVLASSLVTSDSSPWFGVTESLGGLFVAGAADDLKLDVEWGRVVGERIEGIGTDPIRATFAVDEGPRVLPWRLVSERELPSPPLGADAFRIRLRNDEAPASTVAVTAPVAYEEGALAPRLADESRATLVLPNVLPYLPCVRMPRLADGTVEVPHHIVATSDSAWILRDRGTSPFLGVLDLYRLERLPVRRRHGESAETLEILAVDQRIPGALQVQPQRATIVS